MTILESPAHRIKSLTKKIYISARELSELVGKITSTKFIIGNITHEKICSI